MTPYRSARVEGRAPDPSRAKVGLAGAAIASLAVFVSVVRMVTHAGPSVFDGVLLYAGSAAMGLMLVYSAHDAPAGRGLLFASVGAFLLSFVPQTMVRSLMGNWVWPMRYLAIAVIAGALLLRLRRTRPGSSGFLLRLAGLLAAWWGLQWIVAVQWPDGLQSARSELVSRVLYLLLAAGMLDMRRFVGAVPEREPERTTIDTAREVATTRACLGMVSLAAATSALPYAWHSEWTVIAVAEGLALAVTIACHVPWFLAQDARLAQRVILVAAPVALVLGVHAFDARKVAAAAAIASAGVAIAADLAVTDIGASGERGRNPYARTLGAVALHVLTALVIFVRV